MRMVNRSAIVVKPRRPFLEWARQDDPEGLADSVFKSLRGEPYVYLLPEWEEPEERRRILQDFWPDLFEAMLECWVRDEEYWPKERSFQMFQTWFEVQLSSIVEDLQPDEPLGDLE